MSKKLATAMETTATDLDSKLSEAESAAGGDEVEQEIVEEVRNDARSVAETVESVSTAEGAAKEAIDAVLSDDVRNLGGGGGAVCSHSRHSVPPYTHRLAYFPDSFHLSLPAPAPRSRNRLK